MQRRTMIESNRVSQSAFWLTIIGVIVFALIYFRSLIQPFILAIVVWYLIRSTRKLIARISFKGRTMPRWLVGVLSILLTFTILYGVFELISYNVNLIITKSSEYNENLSSLIESVTELTGINDIDAFITEQLSKIDIDVQSFATSTLNVVSVLIGNFALVLVYVIFLLIEENFMPLKLEAILARGDKQGRVSNILDRINKSINTYFTVKFLVSLFTGVLSYVVLLIIGVDFAGLWAFLIFLFNFIPYVGSLVATLLPSFFAVFQFASFLPFLWVFVTVEIIQILVGNYIEPRIVGKTLNLSPLAVILSLSFWGAIWGIIGMLLSVPIISVLVIVMAYFPSTRNVAILLSEKGNIESYIKVN